MLVLAAGSRDPAHVRDPDRFDPDRFNPDRFGLARDTDQNSGILTIPKQPIRQRLKGFPQFVVNRGGEYLFLPALRALQWLAEGT